MTGRKTGAGPSWSTGGALTALALLLGLPGTALAATGGAPTPAGGPPPPPSRTGAPAAAPPSAGVLSLVSARTTPRKSFYDGIRYPQLRFEIGSTQPSNDLRIDVVDSAGEAVKSYFRNDVAPNVAIGVRWDGTTAQGRPARNGRYRFRVLPQSDDPESRRALRRSRVRTSASQPVRLGFAFYVYAFPVLGGHDFGGVGAGFGAGRAGHTHQGQDVMAACGVPLVAARGGTVQYSGYHAAAGNYLVVDGRGTGLDFMYAHLAARSPLGVGDRVRTGEPIGTVGRTGNASACHLHFEIWGRPGWYEGGSPLDPYARLRAWDRYS